MTGNVISRWRGSMNKVVLKKLLNSYENEQNEVKIRFDKGLFYSFLADVKKLLVIDFLRPTFQEEEVVHLLSKVETKLTVLLKDSNVEDIETKVKTFISKLPEIRELLLGSARAIYHGDPAANSIQEIILCYPGFYAISNFRIAHALYELDLKFLARLATEDAHRSTGIDINPGATIGKDFFIDHGTGIVIGETTIIGDRVKLYQSVTLGALSLKNSDALRGKKRHPTVENDCTIYSSASILGGETVIGEGSTIGSNTFITKSIPKRSLVYTSFDELVILPKDK